MHLNHEAALLVLLLVMGAAGCTPKPAGGGTDDDTDDGGTTEIPYVAEEICVGTSRACARLDSGKVACWGGNDFLLDVDAVRMRCGGAICFEDSSGAITCVDRDGVLTTDYIVPPDEIQPMTDWWLDEASSGGCGVQAYSTAVCWPEAYARYDAVWGRYARHIDFTMI